MTETEVLLRRFERVAKKRGVGHVRLGNLTLQNARAYDSLKAGRMWEDTRKKLAKRLDEIEAELSAQDCA